LKAELVVQGDVRTLSSPVELTLFRAGQEGLTNVSKHANASQVRVTLDFKMPGKVRLHVQDDGVGTILSRCTKGFGLLGLRERAQLLGGEVRVQTAPNQGFLLEVEVAG
jgi:signal transduction histidine kinase